MTPKDAAIEADLCRYRLPAAAEDVLGSTSAYEVGPETPFPEAVRLGAAAPSSHLARSLVRAAGADPTRVTRVNPSSILVVALGEMEWPSRTAFVNHDSAFVRAGGGEWAVWKMQDRLWRYVETRSFVASDGRRRERIVEEIAICPPSTMFSEGHELIGDGVAAYLELATRPPASPQGGRAARVLVDDPEVAALLAPERSEGARAGENARRAAAELASHAPGVGRAIALGESPATAIRRLSARLLRRLGRSPDPDLVEVDSMSRLLACMPKGPVWTGVMKAFDEVGAGSGWSWACTPGGPCDDRRLVFERAAAGRVQRVSASSRDLGAALLANAISAAREGGGEWVSR